MLFAIDAENKAVEARNLKHQLENAARQTHDLEENAKGGQGKYVYVHMHILRVRLFL